MRRPVPFMLLTGLAALAGCHPKNAEQAGIVADGPTEPYAKVRHCEAVHFIGSEPFWGGEVQGDKLRYITPENTAGSVIAVTRFAGNNGIGYYGRLDGQPFRMAITPGHCSDTMSDRNYPYVVTLQVHGADMQGCAWTESDPYEGYVRP